MPYSLNHPLQRVVRALAHRPIRSGLLALVVLGAGASFVARSTLLTPPLVELSSKPLYSSGTRDKPTLVLALSVEFPTLGAHYIDLDPAADMRLDDTYSPTVEYLGYFDAESCYTYRGGETDPLRRRFDRIGPATARACGGTGFSGNFMNWATTSNMDVLRQALTGGDRVIDEPGMTVLQRAVLPTNQGFYWNDRNFPTKQLKAALAKGAVPDELRRTSSGTHEGDIWIANCRERVHFGTQKLTSTTSPTGSCNSPGNNSNLGSSLGPTPYMSPDPFFYARVQVCESDASGLKDPRAPDLADKERALCAKYPNGKYKPVGQLQKKSENVRVAAFGYLLDHDNARYGGVLRAPMKYVGAKAFDANGALIEGTNPKMEWSETTGVFVRNPDGAAEGISGVISHLNQYGRNALGKNRDPVGELYYEALRYLQGLPPTPQAAASMTSGMMNGFPVYTTWTDPHAGGSNTQDYSCVRNNILTIADTSTWNDKSIPGNTTRLSTSEFSRTANPSANEPDFHFWTRVVGGFESNNAVSYVDGRGATRTTSNPNPVVNTARWGMENQTTPKQDGGSYYIAGMAYWANTHDIRGSDWSQVEKRRPGMRVTTYMLDVNTYGTQNDPADRRTNQLFLAAKYGGFTDRSGKDNPFLNAAGALDNSNWENPELPGEAKTYLLAGNFRYVMRSVADIFQEIVRKGSSIAGGASSTQRLTDVEGYLYQAQFDPAAWNGDLLSVPVSRNTATNVVTLAKTPKWSAAAQLDLADPLTRKIAVGKAVRDSISAATPFTWAGIEAGLKDALHRPAPNLASDGRGEHRLNYLRGDRSYETVAPTLRIRGSRLGDIVHSGVAYSGAPTQGINAAGYKAFYEANKARTKALFVGANDGMLHAFNADTGNELFAYIPSWLGPKLSLLTKHDYVANHQAYVDSTPVVREALVGSTWKSVLVGGTGAGGQGVYALDVTNPAAFDESKVMWEFTDRDDVDMGNVVGKPQIRKFRVSAPNAAPVYKWFAVVASGVNNHAPDGFASTTGNPAIFLLDLSKPLGTPWVAGSNYYKITVPIDPVISATRAPGVVNFSLTSGNADEVVHMYFGDLHGRMWKLDFSNSAASSANWTMDQLSTFKTAGNTAHPLYVAKDAGGAPQPITLAPNLPVGHNQSTVVVFGTGKYLEPSDNVVNSTTQVQSVYAILDDGKPEMDSTPAGSGAISGRGRLRAGSVSSTGDVTFAPFVWGKAASDGDTTKRSGWYFDLPKSGERQISPSTMFGTKLVFGSVIPPNASTGACSTGSGNHYRLDLLTGAGASQLSSVGLLGQPLILEMGQGTFSKSDSTGRRSRTAKAQIVLQGTEGLAAPPAPGLPQLEHVSHTGRLSWRQLSNYQELRNAP